MARNSALNNEARTYIVQALACFDTPGVVRESIKKEFGIEVSPQAIEAYDPTKRAGRNLAPLWKGIFETARASFLSDMASIAISHRPVRLRALQRMASRAEEMKNIALAAQLIEQAAKEVGDAFTNRRQISGPGGGPLQMISTEMTAKEAADAYASTINGDD